MPKLRVGGKTSTPAKKEYEPVVPQLVSGNTGVLFRRVCWIRCTPKSATYMINGKAYVIPHSQVHDDSESYYVAADYEMSTRCKKPCNLVVKTWLIAQKQYEIKEMAEMLFDAGIYLNEYGKVEADWDDKPLDWDPSDNEDPPPDDDF